MKNPIDTSSELPPLPTKLRKELWGEYWERTLYERERQLSEALREITRLRAELAKQSSPAHGHILETHSVTEVNGAGVQTEYWQECVTCKDTFGEHDFITLCKSSGASLIAVERNRQIESEGWDIDHDDRHRMGEMALASKTYILVACDLICGRKREVYPGWPWEYRWFKPSPDPVRNLVKAGALLAAEIDRLNRVA